MKISTTNEQGRVPITVFQLEGNLDVQSYEQLEQQARAAYDAGSRYMLLDLGKVGYMSSSGLRAIHTLFTMLRSAHDKDGEVQKGIAAGTYKSPNLKLLKPSQGVHQVLQASGFDMFLEIHTDRKAALASF